MSGCWRFVLSYIAIALCFWGCSDDAGSLETPAKSHRAEEFLVNGTISHSRIEEVVVIFGELSSPDQDILYKAIAMHGDRAVPLLLKYMQSTVPYRIRIGCAQTLGEIGKSAIDPIIDYIESEPMCDKGTLIFHTLTFITPSSQRAVDTIIRYMETGDSAERMDAVESLYHVCMRNQVHLVLNYSAALPFLEECLHSPDGKVRRSARKALDAIADATLHQKRLQK